MIFLSFWKKKDNKINSTIPIKETIKNITVENLNFSYNGHDKVLREINVEFKVNRPTVIVGANGAGKSSLIKILAGLYEEYEGNILINGINIKEYEIESYRRKIGIVFQDFNKYEMSLRENIAISNIDVIHSDNFIKSALDKVEMSSLLEIFKDGLDTQMGHWFGGEELSKGQWQRIAVARIWLRNADIIIFDEPTSALDPKMERKFFDLINEIGRNKILILVSHRVKDLLRYNPWFVIMKDGKVVLQGEKEDIKNEEEFKQLIR
ncbi:ABC transporter family protein [Keratinibaculum paraultunense]|uniref:ABC transporter family protein n=1 Tax=Keratinibaculum paraultunense TaxID=1278232 RepID=A0A4V2UTB0_9FIRM|nr:ABC transporter family protein [Keratinibaculum paraultunense]